MQRAARKRLFGIFEPHSVCTERGWRFSVSGEIESQTTRKHVGLAGHPFFEGAGMDPLSAAARVCNENRHIDDQSGRFLRAFVNLPRLCGSLLQQNRKVGRSSSGTTDQPVPFPSFQFLDVHEYNSCNRYHHQDSTHYHHSSPLLLLHCCWRSKLSRF